MAGGHYALAAEEYRQRAREPRERVAATMRRAALLAGPMDNPAGAALELAALRTGANALAQRGPARRDWPS